MKKSLIAIILSTLLGCTMYCSAQEAHTGGNNAHMPPGGQQGKIFNHNKTQFMNKMADWGRGKDVIVAMSELKKSNPEEYAKLDELRRTDISKFMEAIKPYLPKRTNNMPRIGAIECECRDLAQKLKVAKSAEEKTQLEAQLKAKLKESFDFMITDATERIERMSKQLEALKANEEAILEERFNNFMNPPQKPGEPPRK